MELNELYLEDKGIGKVKIMLNNNDITNGIQEYHILRTADNNQSILLELKMKVIPKNVNIQLKENSKLN